MGITLLNEEWYFSHPMLETEFFSNTYLHYL